MIYKRYKIAVVLILITSFVKFSGTTKTWKKFITSNVVLGKGARKREEMAKRLKKIFNEIKPLHFHMENISPYTFVPENITVAPEETVPS